MSGTFNDIDVPPTLVSFAVNVGKKQNMVTPELKEAGNLLVHFKIAKDAYDLPVFENVMQTYDSIMTLMSEKMIVSAYALDAKGVAAALSHMAFGNKLGVTIEQNLEKEALFANALGDIIAEMPKEAVGKLAQMAQASQGALDYTVVGTVTEEPAFVYGDVVITMEEALQVWTSKLDKVFPYTAGKDKSPVDANVYQAKDVYLCKHKVARPTVFIPVFPGTNCEYDSAKAFENAGADVITKVFKNMTAQDIRESVEVFEKAIGQAQIIMFPGGFSAGDEPDGSAKVFCNGVPKRKDERSGYEAFAGKRWPCAWDL